MKNLKNLGEYGTLMNSGKPRLFTISPQTPGPNRSVTPVYRGLGGNVQVGHVTAQPLL